MTEREPDSGAPVAPRSSLPLSSPGQWLLWAPLPALVLVFHNLAREAWRRLRPWDDLLVVAAAIALAVTLVRTRGPKRPWPDFALPALALTGVFLASAAANHPPLNVTAQGFRALLPYILVGLAAYRLCPWSTAPFYARTAAICAGLVAGYGVLEFVTFRAAGGPFMQTPPHNLWERFFLYPHYAGDYLPPLGWRLVSTFLNESYAGIWLAMLIPVTLALGVGERRPWVRWLLLLVAAAGVVACAWTFSRIAALAVVVSLGSYCALRRTPWPLLLLVLGVIAGSTMALSNDVHRFSDVAGTEGGRVASVKQAIGAMIARPLTGYGPGTRRKADVNYAKIGYETGALGLAVFLWLIFSSLKPGVNRSVLDDPLASALLAAMLAVAAGAMASEAWERPQIAYYYWLFAGLLARRCADLGQSSARNASSRR